ncbi:MAG: hypothetical protein OXQ27_08860 [Chloroflexota bacterium]|nr:hypothetical protein [Chloroflexota bacterium]
MSLSVRETGLHVLNMQTRMRFRYGIASLVAVPHLFVRLEADIDGAREVGLAADGLPPKWFTKYPATSFSDDLDEMLAVIRQACALTEEAPPADSVFAFWHRLHEQQEAWAAETGYPPLLWGFGVSLVERALIDAFCRSTGTPFARALCDDSLGIELGAIHPELAGFSPAELLPAEPQRSVIVRHTVGLSDPLTDEEIPAEERVDDGLPQSLAASIRSYGLTHFKILISGDAAADLTRLRQVASAVEEHVFGDYAFTLDGSEQYTEVEPFRQAWEAIRAEPTLHEFLDHLLFVEQPLRRDMALSPEAKAELRAWSDRPPLIIDESDGTLSSVVAALDGGYVGASFKNCKGVFGGIANACLLAKRRRGDPGGYYVQSSEDLASVGPVSMLQDLAVLASLGIEHSQRNGHHYFAGLSMFPADVQADVLAKHATLYRRHDRGYPVLDVREGRLDTGSVVAAPFGYGVELDTRRFTPLEQWTVESL